MRTSRIEDWFILQIPSKELILCGTVYGDDRYNPDTTEFQDGHHIMTSPIQEFMEVALEGHSIRTRNTIYKLGKKMEKRDSYWLKRLGPEVNVG